MIYLYIIICLFLTNCTNTNPPDTGDFQRVFGKQNKENFPVKLFCKLIDDSILNSMPVLKKFEGDYILGNNLLFYIVSGADFSNSFNFNNESLKEIYIQTKSGLISHPSGVFVNFKAIHRKTNSLLELIGSKNYIKKDDNQCILKTFWTHKKTNKEQLIQYQVDLKTPSLEIHNSLHSDFFTSFNYYIGNQVYRFGGKISSFLKHNSFSNENKKYPIYINSYTNKPQFTKNSIKKEKKSLNRSLLFLPTRQIYNSKYFSNSRHLKEFTIKLVNLNYQKTIFKNKYFTRNIYSNSEKIYNIKGNLGQSIKMNLPNKSQNRIKIFSNKGKERIYNINPIKENIFFEGEKEDPISLTINHLNLNTKKQPSTQIFEVNEISKNILPNPVVIPFARSQTFKIPKGSFYLKILNSNSAIQCQYYLKNLIEKKLAISCDHSKKPVPVSKSRKMILPKSKNSDHQFISNDSKFIVSIPKKNNITNKEHEINSFDQAIRISKLFQNRYKITLKCSGELDSLGSLLNILDQLTPNFLEIDNCFNKNNNIIKSFHLVKSSRFHKNINLKTENSFLLTEKKPITISLENLIEQSKSNQSNFKNTLDLTAKLIYSSTSQNSHILNISINNPRIKIFQIILYINGEIFESFDSNKLVLKHKSNIHLNKKVNYYRIGVILSPISYFQKTHTLIPNEYKYYSSKIFSGIN